MSDKKKNKKAAPKAVKATSAAKKTTSKKTVAKKPAKAKATPKKRTSPTTKQPAPKAKAPKRVKALKPDIAYENSTDDDKILIIGGKKNKPKKRQPKVLRRAGQVGGYTAWDGKTGKTFATEKEAVGYASDVCARTGEIIAVTRTDRKVTHTFKAENKSDNK